jgi:uncharacterized membrane protein YhhN
MITKRLHGFILIYAAAASVFLICMAMDIVGLGRTMLKAIPVSMLIVLVFRDLRGFARICLVGALFGSVCGDILLDLPYAGVFIFGLAAFLVGHLFYTVLFFRYAKRPDGSDKVTIAGLVLFAGMMIWIFRAIPPALYGPVVLYIVVIVTMSIGALLVPAESRRLFWGALLFIASDVILAVHKFLIVIPNGRLINISLYFIAQLTIITAARTIWADTGEEDARNSIGRNKPRGSGTDGNRRTG